MAANYTELRKSDMQFFVSSIYSLHVGNAAIRQSVELLREP